MSDTTTDDLPPDQVLAAAKSNLKSVIVIGYDNEENLYVASSQGDQREILWLLLQSILEVFDAETA